MFLDKTSYFYKVWKNLSHNKNMDRMFSLITSEIISKNTEVYFDHVGDAVYKLEIKEFGKTVPSLPEIVAYIDFLTLETKVKVGSDYFKYQWFGYRPCIRTLRRLFTAIYNYLELNPTKYSTWIGFDFLRKRFYYILSHGLLHIGAPSLHTEEDSKEFQEWKENSESYKFRKSLWR